jgi:hypothetical protein
MEGKLQKADFAPSPPLATSAKGAKSAKILEAGHKDREVIVMRRGQQQD